MSTDAAFWNRIAAKYARSPVRNPTAYAETLAEVIGLLSPRDRVLELGCGTGTTALKLAPHVRTITATDISPEMIEIAEQKRQAGGIVNAGFATAGIAAPDADALPYDAVLAFNLLHLIRDLDAALAAIHAQIKPGGLFISKSGCIAEMNWLFRPLIRAMQMVGKAPYVSVLAKRDLEAAISRAGFVLEQSRTFTGAPESLFVVARKPG
ncbi:class I SAM-dependent DNA methyltransferase [Antarcticimicrobium luteum]|uniref:Class I SAM-dependent methyltransferase n=1 Tax=Antarcticimicrobium luteum TaxID=2547397 RepID=A0A4R5VD71_9RHOB|nr:class I SAM-dependent methyltransferase [Antarcticimicrobium luteum]TDK50061.1 class I SAM-dependent methyltransferase [Antarcticimicrobium luteum]